MPFNKSVISLSALACLLLLSAPIQALEISGGSAEDQATLKAIADKWVADYLAGDIDGLMSVMHEDGMVLSEKQDTIHGLDSIRAYFEARAGKPGVTFTDDLQEIRINGNWAFVRGNFVLEVAPWEEGKPGFKRNGRYFVLYEKNANGEWKMLRDIDNDAPASD